MLSSKIIIATILSIIAATDNYSTSGTANAYGSITNNNGYAVKNPVATPAYGDNKPEESNPTYKTEPTKEENNSGYEYTSNKPTNADESCEDNSVDYRNLQEPSYENEPYKQDTPEESDDYKPDEPKNDYNNSPDNEEYHEKNPQDASHTDQGSGYKPDSNPKTPYGENKPEYTTPDQSNPAYKPITDKIPEIITGGSKPVETRKPVGYGEPVNDSGYKNNHGNGYNGGEGILGRNSLGLGKHTGHGGYLWNPSRSHHGFLSRPLIDIKAGILNGLTGNYGGSNYRASNGLHGRRSRHNNLWNGHGSLVNVDADVLNNRDINHGLSDYSRNSRISQGPAIDVTANVLNGYRK